jgi:hypothetical protein
VIGGDATLCLIGAAVAPLLAGLVIAVLCGS